MREGIANVSSAVPGGRGGQGESLGQSPGGVSGEAEVGFEESTLLAENGQFTQRRMRGHWPATTITQVASTNTAGRTDFTLACLSERHGTTSGAQPTLPPNAANEGGGTGVANAGLFAALRFVANGRLRGC